MTEHLKMLVSPNWHDIEGFSLVDKFNLIRSHNIDILIDLNGHAYGGSVELMVLKPAPIIMSYLGYPNHTLVDEYDYRISDRIADPPSNQEDDMQKEETIYLPRSFLCYQPFPMFQMQDINMNVSDEKVHIGIFNKIAKHNVVIRDIWKRLLKKHPNVILHIKLNNFEKSTMVYRSFPPKQLKYIQFDNNLNKYYQNYNKVDMCVDTFPYSGTATTCSSLLMGIVPYTIYGRDRHVSSVSASLLLNMDLKEQVCDTTDEYFDKISREIDRITTEKNTNNDKYIEYVNEARNNIRNEFLYFMEPNTFVSEYEEMLESTYKKHFE